MKKLSFVLFILLIAFGINLWGATPVSMSGLTYTENFSDIVNWTNNFATGIGASAFGSVAINATGTIPDGVKTTASTATFATGSSGGVQRGSAQTPITTTILLLSTGATDNTASCAIDFFMDFTGVNAGTLSFDWATVFNSSGNRCSSIRVYYSINGTTFTEITAAQVLNKANNVTASGSITAVALPAAFNNCATARLRFYEYNGTGGTTGSRSKISIDNLNVTATAASSPTITLTGTLSAFSTVSGTASNYQSYKVSGANLTADITVTAPTDYELCKTSGGTYTNGLTFAQAGGSVAEQDIFVRIAASAPAGSPNGNITHVSTTASVNKAVSGTVYKTEPSNHVAGFAAATGSPSWSTIALSWTDAAKVTPDGYLIKGSSVGYASIVDPVDFTPETDAFLVYNVAQGAQTYSVIGLASATTYYFKIYPYTNSGTAINYKVAGAPQDDQITDPEPNLLYYWNFNTNPPTSPANWTQPLASDIGSGNLSYTLTAATSFSGSTLNGVLSEVAGGCFAPVDMANNLNYFELAIPTTSYQDIQISYATRGTATGFTTHYVYYSLDGSNFVLMQTFTGMNSTSWSVKSVDFTSIAAANNNANFKVRIVVDGATNISGNNRFDNIKILGNPLLTPVELSSFTAVLTAQNYVMIQWTTQSETGVSGYYIYRNTQLDVANAYRIPSLIQATNTSQETNYAFVDQDVSAGNTYYYWLQNVEMNGESNFYGPISVVINNNNGPETPIIPKTTALLNSYPNPFSSAAWIPYTVKDAASVQIEIYNIRGQLIRTFNHKQAKSGLFSARWDGTDMNGKPVSSGLYYYRMTSGNYTSTKTAILMK